MKTQPPHRSTQKQPNGNATATTTAQLKFNDNFEKGLGEQHIRRTRKLEKSSQNRLKGRSQNSALRIPTATTGTAKSVDEDVEHLSVTKANENHST